MPRVLLVHDDIAEISTVKRVLARAGHRPALATTSTEATDAIERDRPELLVLGSTCEGGAALRAIAPVADASRIPMVVLGLTAAAPESAAQVPRPIDPAQLAERIAAALASPPEPSGAGIPDGALPAADAAAARPSRREAAAALRARAEELRRAAARATEAPPSAPPAPSTAAGPARGGGAGAQPSASAARRRGEGGPEAIFGRTGDGAEQEDAARRGAAAAAGSGAKAAGGESPRSAGSEAAAVARRRPDLELDLELELLGRQLDEELRRRGERTAPAAAEGRKPSPSALAAPPPRAAQPAPAPSAPPREPPSRDREERARLRRGANRESVRPGASQGAPAPQRTAASAPDPAEEPAPRRTEPLPGRPDTSPPLRPAGRPPGPAGVEPGVERSAPRGGPPPPELRAGSLADLPAPRLFAMAARAAVSGRIDFEGERSRSLYFEGGAVVGATSSDPGERIEEIALRLGLVTREQHRQLSAAASPAATRRAALVLLERGYLKPTELTGLVRRRTEEVVFGVFGDAGARFRWTDAAVPPDERTVLDRTTLALAVEGVRRRWLAPAVDAVLGGAGTILAPVAGGPSPDELALTADERRALSLADGLRALDEILAASPLDPLSTRQALAALVLVGALEVRGFQAGERAEAESAAIDLARVREKLDQVRRADYFTVLGVGRLCTPHEVREACERLRAEFDPRRFRGVGEEGLEELLREILAVVGDARDVLADERLRDEYLRGLGL